MFIITLKAPVTTAADANVFYLFFFIYFSEKTSLEFYVNHLLGR